MQRWHPRRPLYTVALVVCVTTALLLAIGEENGWQAALIATVGLAVVLCVPKLRRIDILYLILFGVLLSSLSTFLYYTHEVQPLSRLDGKTAQITARVTAVSEGEEKRYSVTVLESNLLPSGTCLSVTVGNEYIDLERYGSVHGTVSLHTSANKALHGDGVFLTGKLETVMKSKKGLPYWHESLSEFLREGLLEGIYRWMPPKEAAFAAGVCVGEVRGLSEQVDTDFRKSGLAHLTVVSGLHMSILSAATLGFLKCLRVRRSIRTVVTLAVLWLFTLVVGFSVSVIRASVMLHCILIGESFRRRADSRTSLAVALLMIVLQNPYALQDVGFLLSFTATWGLVVLMPLWNALLDSFPCIKKRIWLRNVLQPIGCSLAAMVFTAPVLAYAFGTVAVLSPIANVLTGVPVTVMLPLTLASGLLYHLPIVCVLARPCLWVAAMLARWIMWVAHMVGQLSDTGLQIRHPVWLFLLLFLPFSLYWAAKLGGKRGVLRIVITNFVLTVVFIAAFSCIFHRNTFVRVAASGSSTVAVMETAGLTAAVISGDTAYSYNAARRCLLSCGVTSLDVLIVTDINKSSAANLVPLLREVPTGTVLCSKYDVAKTAAYVADDVPFVISETVSAETKDGWWRLDIGQTRVLFAPPDGTLTELPPEWHRAHLAVVRKATPEDVAFLTERRVVVCKGEYANTQAAFCTRGKGDLTPCGRFWL